MRAPPDSADGPGHAHPGTAAETLSHPNDEHDRTTIEPVALRAAFAYARRGLACLPLRGGAPAKLGKRPVTPNGLLDATTDPAQLEQWFRAGRYTAIGVAVPDNVAIIDVDPRNGGDEDLAAWNDEHDDAWFDVPPLALTGGSSPGVPTGFHLWYPRPDGDLRNPTRGIECLRKGKYVVMPPTMTENEYIWRRTLPLDLHHLPEMPEWLRAKCVRPVDEWEQAITSAPSYVRDGTDRLDRVAHEYTSFQALLSAARWVLKRGDGDSDGSRWRHPDSDNDVSATIKYGCLFVYSYRTPFVQTVTGEPHGYTLFRAISVLEFDGDLKAARKKLVGDDDRAALRRWMATFEKAGS